MTRVFTITAALTQVRHERGGKSAKCFRISSGDGGVYTTFATKIKPIWKAQAELLEQ